MNAAFMLSMIQYKHTIVKYLKYLLYFKIYDLCDDKAAI